MSMGRPLLSLSVMGMMFFAGVRIGRDTDPRKVDELCQFLKMAHDFENEHPEQRCFQPGCSNCTDPSFPVIGGDKLLECENSKDEFKRLLGEALVAAVKATELSNYYQSENLRCRENKTI